MNRVDYWLTIAAMCVAIAAGAFLMVIPCVREDQAWECVRSVMGW